MKLEESMDNLKEALELYYGTETTISEDSDPFYSKGNQANLKESVKQLRDGKGKLDEMLENKNN